MPIQLDELAQRLAAMLHQQHSVDADDAAQVLRQYTHACKQINSRITKAHGLLKKGHRAEALQECEREPNLLDSLESLDVADYQLVVKLYQQLKHEAPPALLLDAGAALNDAYAAQNAASPLLRSHRLLALARAPIASRIKILQKLCETDENPTQWISDLQSYHAARIREMGETLARAERESDLAVVMSLTQELAETKWVTEVPAGFKIEMQRVLDAVLVASAKVQLAETNPEFISAYGELDVDRARSIHAKWQQLSRQAKLNAHDPLFQDVEPAIEWLREEEDKATLRRTFAANLDSLTALLETPRATLQELETAYAQLTNTEQEVPDVVKLRFSNKSAELRLRETRAYRLKLLATCSAMLLLAAVIFLLGQRHRVNREVQAAIAQLRNYAEQLEFSAGDKFLTDFKARSPAAMRDPLLTAELNSYEQLRSNDESRSKAFVLALGSISDDGRSVDDRTYLKTAEGLARTQREREELRAAVAKVTAAEELISRDHSTQFLEVIKVTKSKLQDLRKKASVSESDYALLVDSLETAYHQYPRINQDARRLGDVLKTTLAGLKSSAALNATLAKRRLDATNAVGNFDSFLAALRRIADTVPGTTSESEIIRTIQGAESLRIAIDWKIAQDAFMKSLTQDRSLSPDEASDILERIKSLQDRKFHVDGPQFLSSRVEYLTKVAARKDATGQSICAPLIKVYQGRIFNGVFCMELPADAAGAAPTRYYFAKKNPFQGGADSSGGRVIDYLVDPVTFATSRVRVSKPQLIQAAPHVVYRGFCEPLLTNLTTDHGVATWESTYAKLIQRLLAASDEDRDRAPQLDPLLAYFLLRDLIAVGRQGSHALDLALRDWQERLDAANVNVTANWLLPNDSVLQQSRSAADNILSELRAETVAKWANSARATLLADTTAVAQLEWVGWLSRDGKADLQLQTGRSLQPGRLFALVAGTDADARIDLVSIGVVDSARIRLDIADARIIEGMAVYHVAEQIDG